MNAVSALDTGAPTVRVTRRYRASITAAFDAWADPASLEQWFGPPGFHAKVLTHEFEAGGTWRFLMSRDGNSGFHHFGSFIEIERPHRLVFTWQSEEPIAGWQDTSLVTVEFTAAPPWVDVAIVHENLGTEPARQSLTAGWSGGLDSFATYLEGKGKTP